MSLVRVVFLGPPGAGKGTQAARFAAEAGIPHISTGEILRRAVADGTPLGREARKYLDAGTLVPDDVMTDVVDERLRAADCSSGFLLDGFPRTARQAELLEKALARSGRHLTHVVLIDVPREELVRRMMGRGRADDTPETVARRLDVYESQTEPLKGWYRGRGLLRSVDGLGTPEDVYGRLRAAVGASAR